MRGHSSINASVDLALRVRRNSSTVTVDATKVRDADIAPIRAQFRFVHRKDARELEQAWFTDVSDTGVEQKVLAAARKSLAGGNEMKKTDLVAGVKRQMSELGGKKIGALLASASEGGDLRVRNGAHNAQLSSLPSGEDR